MVQCCCESVCPRSGQLATLWHSSVALAWLSMCQCLSQISFILCDAVGCDDFCALYICEASAGVASVDLGGLGIVSASLCLSLSFRYATSIQLSIWWYSLARMGIDPLA